MGVGGCGGPWFSRTPAGWGGGRRGVPAGEAVDGLLRRSEGWSPCGTDRGLAAAGGAAVVAAAAGVGLVAVPAEGLERSPVPPDPAPGGPRRRNELTGRRTSTVWPVGSLRTATSGKGVLVGVDRTSRPESEGPAGRRPPLRVPLRRRVRLPPDALPTCAVTTVESGGVAARPVDALAGRGTEQPRPRGHRGGVRRQHPPQAAPSS